MNVPTHTKKDDEKIRVDNMCPEQGGNSAGYAIGAVILVVLAVAIALWFASGLKHEPRTTWQSSVEQLNQDPYPDRIVLPMRSVPVKLK